MIRPLTAAVLLLAAVVAVRALVAALSRRTAGGAGLLQLGLVGQAVLDVVGLAAGHRPHEPAVHVGYLVASVALLPAVVAAVPVEGPRAASLRLALTAVALFVVCVRMWATWLP